MRSRPKEGLPMQAIVCDRPGTLSIQEVAKPEPGPGMALIRVVATGVCGSDVRGYLGTHPDIVDYPVILGHEFAGVVDAVGDGVSHVAPGDRVAVEPLFVCGVCRACREGTYHLCARLELNGHQHPGSFAEWTVAPARFCYPVPGAMDFEIAALAEPAAVAVHAANRARPKLGDRAVVLGMGPIGLLCLQALRLSGCRVMGVDVVPAKLELAREMGAELAVDASATDAIEAVTDWTDGVGADVVLESAGVRETLAETVFMVRKGGTVVLLGFTGEDTDPICLTRLMIKEANFLGSVIYSQRDVPDAIELLASGDLVGRPLITDRCDLAGLVDMVPAAQDKSGGMLKPMCLLS
ncbi:MAG: alcohol dehydrogenase catalytic domain-containing protein [Armatimonadia bacterium]|nr:alcohol dehydrogenase catalytic domain-containing protein [Armatimonadia bacterium]